MPMELQLEGLTLSNAGEGGLEELFQECLADAMEVVKEPHRYRESPAGVVTAVITAEIRIVHRIPADGGHGTTVLELGCNLKKPKRKTHGQPVYTRDGVFLAEVDPAEQLAFADSQSTRTAPTPLRRDVEA